MSEVVDGDGNFITDFSADICHILFQIIESDFRKVDAGKGVRGIKKIIRRTAHGGGIDGTMRCFEDLLVLFHCFDEAQRRRERAGNIHQKFNTQIHFEKSKALFHARFESFSHITAMTFAVGIAVTADLIAELAAKKLPDGNAPRFSGNIPAGNFNSANAACLPGIAAELFDAAEDLFHVAGVFPQNTAFEHGGVGGTGSIAYFAVADQALIGIKFDQSTPFGRAVDLGKAHIGDLQS